MSEKLGLYKKISQVMQEVAYLSKDDQISFGQTKYRAISEEKVTTAVRESLIRNGLVILPFEQTHTKDGNLSTVDVKYKIIDIDTGEFEVIVSSGTGADTQDKGVGKAMTYAYKYLMLRTFAIPTGEDPDKISSAELDDKQRKEAEKAAKAKEQEDKRTLTEVKAKWQTLAGDLNGFDSWYEEQSSKGVTVQQMNEVLTKRMMKKESA